MQTGDMVAAAVDPPFSPREPRAAIDCSKVQGELVSRTAEERIAWAEETFGDDLVLLSSMQKTGVVLMHMLHRLGLPNEIVFVDTGYHFIETLRLRDECTRAWRLNLVTLYPSLPPAEQECQHHRMLFLTHDGQPSCCRLRKEAPLLEYLKAKRNPVLAGGLRRAEGGRRTNLRVLSPDHRTGGYQFAPLFDWTDTAVEAYIAQHALPVHPLYQLSYASIGCYPCTTPIAAGEDKRAGRWRHLRPIGGPSGPQYCGINFSDGDGI